MVSRCDTTPDLVINTLPRAAESFFFDFVMDGLQEQAVLVDINYHVQRPTLLARGESMGLMTVDGRPMFLWQATLRFQRWLGEMPNMNLGRDALGL